MNDHVSVVIPCHGQAHFLPDALASLAAQTRPPDEVVVIDDGSPDDVAGAAAGFERVRVVHQENRGLSGARNRGIVEISGGFVVFLAAADRLLPHAVETNLRELRAHPDAAFSWGFNRSIDESGDRDRWPPTSFEGVPTYARLLETNVVGGPVGVMFRRLMLIEAGGFRTDLPAAEDYECYLRLARTHPFVCAREVIGEYRVHGENRSGNLPLMYDAVRTVLRDEEPYVRHDRELRAALARGRRDARLRYDARGRIERLADEVAAKRWGAAVTSALGLLVRYPKLFLTTVGRRLSRRR